MVIMATLLSLEVLHQFCVMTFQGKRT